MSLTSGDYLTKVNRQVVVWPAADAKGDGEPVWVEQYDNDGNNIGRLEEKNRWGEKVRAYLPPKGFQNKPGYDNTPNYVLVTEHGGIYRQPNGEAVCIRPGQAIVFNPDGTTEVLSDEYRQYVFEQGHDAVDEFGTVLVKADSLEEETEEDLLKRRLAEIVAEKAGQ